MNNSFPKLPEWFLRLIISDELWEEISGDLEELYADRLGRYGKLKARLYTWGDVFGCMRNVAVRRSGDSINSIHMLGHYIKISSRNLLRNKSFTLINVLGLSTSMSIALLIILFWIDQGRMDAHNPDADSTYRVITKYDENEDGDESLIATSPGELGKLAALNIKASGEIAQLVKTSGNVKYGENLFAYKGLYATSNFFEFFNFKTTRGSKGVLNKPNGVVLSKRLAEKLFGQSYELGTHLDLGNLGLFEVTGIVDEEIYKSHINYDLLLPLAAFEKNKKNEAIVNDWELSYKNYYNYVKLKDASPSQLANFVTGIETRFSQDRRNKYAFDIQRLSDINLGIPMKNEIGVTTPSFILYFLVVLVFTVLVSASFNYMNLSVARALKRAKETGVRKMMGSQKRQIIIQFLVEAQMVTWISLLFGCLLLQLLVPIFNNLKVLRDIDGVITLDFVTDLNVYLIFIGFAVIIGLVSGIYPALYLSSFKPLEAVKKATNAGRSPSFLLRKILLFFQYTFSLTFIITTIVLYKQAELMINADFGFDRERMINVPLHGIPYEAFRNELLKENVIEDVSAVSNLPILSGFKEGKIESKRVEGGEVNADYLSIDPFTVESLSLQLLAGRNFDEQRETDKNNAWIINEKSLHALGFERAEDAITQPLKIKQETSTGSIIAEGRIIGVIKDFSYKFVIMESGPLVINYDPSKLTTAMIRFRSVDHAEAAEIVEGVWKAFDTIHPFDYTFYDYEIEDINAELVDVIGILGLVSLLALMIASLGQFSMVVHHLQLKIKEIGIRKVLGSSTSGLMFKLSREFILLMSLSIGVALPFSWLINNAWTSQLAIHPEVSFDVLLLGAGIVIAISVLTIFKIVNQAARANPVKALKYE